jgi:hypothetical protein
MGQRKFLAARFTSRPMAFLYFINPCNLKTTGFRNSTLSFLLASFSSGMATVSHVELQQLLDNLVAAAKTYDETRTVGGFESRATIRSAARDLISATSTPEDHVWGQVLHVSHGPKRSFRWLTLNG